MKRTLILLAVFLLSLFSGYSQDYKVVKGKRPPVNLNKVPKDAYYPGILKIKFSPEMSAVLEKNGIRKTADGIIQFGIKPVDNLMLKYKIKQADPVFKLPGNAKFSEKHKAWGFDRWYRLTVDPNADIKALVKEFEGLAEIELAEPEYKKVLYSLNNTFVKYTPNDSLYPQQWHYNNTGQSGGTIDADIDLPEAWDIETGDTNVLVAVIDGGIQIDHPDLKDNISYLVGFNFVDSTTTIVPHDHGTHVSGTIAAKNNNTTGVSGIAGGINGTNDGVRLLSCQVFTDNGAGGFDVAPVWAADQGAAISQNSWGYTQVGVYDQSVLDAIDYFKANGGGNILNGGVVFFAAGNDGSSGQWYPGCYENVIAVAATNDKDQKAWYSNYDTWVDISAPGGETSESFDKGVLSTVTGGGYDWYQGTSMATPHVSGVAALVLSKAVKDGIVLNNTDLERILLNSTDFIDDINSQYAGMLGTGRLNAYKALVYYQDFIDSLEPPSNFSVVAVDSQSISLHWELDPAGDTVVVLYSLINDFPDLTDGIPVAVGDTIGSAVVIYKGTDTSFIHSGLESYTYYYYRAYSVKTGDNYSLPVEGYGHTLCTKFNTFPLVVDFEDGALPMCWEAIGAEWMFNASGGYAGNPNGALSGDYNALFYSSNADGMLISPVLDLSGANTATLTFWHAQANWAGDQDTLIVLYKNSSTQIDWDTLAIYGDDIPDWTMEIIDLPNLSGEYSIAFYAKARYGYGIVLDDIYVLKDQPVPPFVSLSDSIVSDIDNATLFAEIQNVSQVQILQSGFVVSNSTDPTIGAPDATVVSTSTPVQSGAYQAQVTGLESGQTYWYAAYLITATDTVYSATKQFKTLCKLTTLPYVEDFEDGIMPDCWSDPSGEWTVQQGIGGDIDTAYSGDYNLYLYSSDLLVATVYMPVIDLTDINGPVQLSFYHAQQNWAGDQDELRVYVKSGSNGTWTKVLEFTQSIDQWTKDSVMLPTGDLVYIAFEGTADYGYGIGIDYVTVTYNNLSDVDDNSTSFIVYPNPAADRFTVIAPSEGYVLTVYDQTGRLVLKRNLQGDRTTVSGDLQPGVYILRLSNQTKVMTGKLIVK